MMRRTSALLTILTLLLGIQFMANPAQTEALSGSDFDASRIIDDSVFFNSGTMNPGDIQAFLNAKVPSCRSGYTCLKDFSQSYGTVSGDAYCGTLTGGTKTAAQIINDVAKECGINPQALIVLLQKEQSLITDTWPVASQYRSATGYGCPDGASCDAQYYGFFNQVYRAARQFKRYVQLPGQYNYAAGRNSFIAYQALKPECGGSYVTIQNGATAALYNYTPYQPNAAALTNLYGTGDGCSAYGNRNFWRLFNDWFGSTYAGYLMRTVNNSTVYLVSGDNKFPIADIRLFDSLRPLGPLTFVSDSYLNGKTTGPTLGRILRSSNGTVFFTDSGIKLPFGSCAMVDRYGYDCGDSILLEDHILDRLHTGPFVTVLYTTTSGKRFYIDAGTKREIYDNISLANAGVSGGANVLAESGIGYLPYGTPLVRNDTIILERGSSTRRLYVQNAIKIIESSLYNQTALKSVFPKAALDLQSITKLTQSGSLGGLVRNTAGTEHYLIGDPGKVVLSEPSRWTNNFSTLPDSFLAALPTVASSINSNLVVGFSNGTVYYIDSAQKRPIGGWNDLLKINAQPSINKVSDHIIRNITSGAQLLGPSSLVKTPNNGTVYMIDGLSKKIPLSSFSPAIDSGVSTSVNTVSSSVLDAYSASTEVLHSRVTCLGKNYLASEGGLYEVTTALQSHYNLTYIPLDALTCRNIPKHSTQLNRFIRTPNGTIYYIENGRKRPFDSFNKYLEYGGGPAAGVSYYAAGQIPTGSIAN